MAITTIDLSTLDGSNGFRLDGVAKGDTSGGSVSNAGDVNGDGFDDLLIGAPNADPNGGGSGSSYVVFGKAAGFDVSMNLSDLDGNNGFRLDGAAKDDTSGGSVSNAGDVNGDGFDDLLVGAPNADPNGDGSGSSYVVFGKASGFAAAMNLSDLDGNNGFRLDGTTAFTGAGRLISSAGDMNGDGFNDVIVGNRQFNNDYSVPVTADYVVFGKASGFSATFDLSDLNGSNGFLLDINKDVAISQSVSSIGDMNGDGFDDVIVSVHSPSYTENFAESYVIFGKASGFNASVNLSELDGSDGFHISGTQVGEYGGRLRVSGAGDINSDGFDDVIIGTPEEGGYVGSSYVVFGHASAFDAELSLSLDGSNGFRVVGTDVSYSFGSSVSGAGDVNGDGFMDVIIGVPDVGSNDVPSSYVVFGKASGFDAVMDVSDLDNNSGIRLDGSYNAFSDAGDVNGDGFDDLLVGEANANPNGKNSGSSYVIFGSQLFEGTMTYVGTKGDDHFSGTTAAERFEVGGGNDTLTGGGGADIFQAGDGDDIIYVPDLTFQALNGGKGFDKLVLTGGGLNLNLANFHDTISDIDAIDLTGSGDNTLTLTLSDLYDTSANTLKIDGDAGDHVVIRGGGWLDGGIQGGYHMYTNRDGAALLVDVAVNMDPLALGGVFSLASINGSNGFRLDGEMYDSSGKSVSNAGDVNGDGFDDVIIGAPGAEPNGEYSGSSYVVFGKASGFDATINLSNLDGSNGFSLSGVMTSDKSGYSVSGAGDVNGDGFDDVIVGAYAADPNGKDSGSSYVVFGRASGFDATINLANLDGRNGFRLDGGDKGLSSGRVVSSAGDVNGDGFSDVMVSAVYRGLHGFYGASFVVFGKASGVDAAVNLSSLNGNNGFRLNGESNHSGSHLSLSNAGDINGDGFADLIIGDPFAETNGSKSGSSYLVFGKATGFGARLDLSGVDGNNGFRLDGAATDDGAGSSVSNAGDVNGDGFDDLLIGASGASAGYVVFGKSSSFDATLNVGSLDGENGFRMDGLGSDGIGGAMSGAGDVNGDGFDDLLASTNVGDLNGASYVVFGKASGFNATLDLSTLDGTEGVRIDGTRDDNTTDRSVSGAGDINSDGFDDLLIGETSASPNGERSGSTYVVFGHNDFGGGVPDIIGTPGDDNLIGTPLAERFEAGDGNDHINGHGGTDIFLAGNGDDVIAIPELNFQIADGGSGTDTLMLTDSGVNLNLVDFQDRISGIETIDLSGNGDNILMLTLPSLLALSDTTDTFTVDGNRGDRVYGLISGWEDGGIEGDYHVYHNQGTTLRVTTAVNTDWLKPGINLSDLDGSNGFRLDGEMSWDESGRSVSSAGDLNGDGFDDVIVGAPGADLGGNDSGASYVIFGHASGFDATLSLASLNGDNGFLLQDTGLSGSGFSVSNAGDVNGDGFADVIVGTSSAGAGYVVFGRNSGFHAKLNLSALDGKNGFRMTGGAADDRAGVSVSSAGDVNNDGFDDVLIGADGRSNGYSVSCYVVFGRPSGFDATVNLGNLDGNDGFRLDGIGKHNYSRVSVSSAGDFNGDGFDDLLVGDPGVDPNGTRSGASYVVFGKSTGFSASMDLSSLDGSNGFRLDGENKYDSSGASVSGAGDVNGDGFDDLIIGAPYSGSVYSGSSYVVFGHASGFGATMNLASLDGNNGFRLNGITAEDRSGYSVSSAGDVNGDGFDDLLIGADIANLNSQVSGSSYVVFGHASGFSAEMDLSSLDGSNGIRLDGVEAFSRSGFSVSGAGDVNGDGFDDLLVGAPYADPNGDSSGSSYVIFGRSDFGGGQLPTIPGTSDDNVLRGTSAAEIFEAGDGNDMMIGGGGADIFHGGAGADQIKIPDLNFESVDGGTGNDILHLGGTNLNLDLTAFGDKMQGIEIICLYGRGDNTLTLTADSLLDLSNTSNTLKLNGNAGDRVAVQDSGWVDGGVKGFYHTYINGDAVLLLGANLAIDFIM